MKAVKINKPFDVQIVEMDKPQIEKKDDVILKVTSGGICGSDMGIWQGTNSLATYPRLIGHEFGGIVTEVGEDVSSISEGDLVAVDPVVSCGKCYACTHGHPNVCKDVEVMGVHRDGGFSEYVKAPARNIHKFSKPYDETLVGLVEPYSIGTEVNNRADIQENDKVLILGSGPIGVTTMQVAKRRGAEVMITDLVQERLDLAKEMGADIIVNTKQNNLNDYLKDFNNGEGPTVVVDTVCQPATFKQSIEVASPAGRVVVLSTNNKEVTTDASLITKKGLTIVGSRLNNGRFPEVIEGFENGSLNPEKLMSKQIDFNNVESEGFKVIKETPEKVMKVVLKF